MATQNQDDIYNDDVEATVQQPKAVVPGGGNADGGNSANAGTDGNTSVGTGTTGTGTTAGGGTTEIGGSQRKGIQTDGGAVTAPEWVKVNNNAELIAELERRMKETEPMSKEDLAKLRRKQRTEGIISGVADAAQSIANLFYTTKGAPNMYNAENSMTAKAKERWDKAKAEREAKDKEWLNYAMQIGKLKGEDQKRGLQVWQAEQKANNNSTLNNAKTGYYNQLTEKEAWNANKAQTDAEAEPIVLQDKHDVSQSTIKRNNASATASIAKANKANSDTKKKKSFCGQEYETNTEYGTLVRTMAKEYGIPTTTTNLMGKEAARNTGDIAADVMIEYKKRQEQQKKEQGAGGNTGNGNGTEKNKTNVNWAK